jgi:excinuclease UvrABC nuclease subunit
MDNPTHDAYPQGVTSVYKYFDGKGRLLYVGVTARGIRRTQEHAESKQWWPLCAGCGIEHYDTRDKALDREQELIQRHHPPYNTVHNHRKAEARAAYESHKPRVVLGEMNGASLKRAQAEFMKLPKHVKRVTPCIVCHVNTAGSRGRCDPCLQEYRRAAGGGAQTKPDPLTVE